MSYLLAVWVNREHLKNWIRALLGNLLFILILFVLMNVGLIPDVVVRSDYVSIIVVDLTLFTAAHPYTPLKNKKKQ